MKRRKPGAEGTGFRSYRGSTASIARSVPHGIDSESVYFVEPLYAVLHGRQCP